MRCHSDGKLIPCVTLESDRQPVAAGWRTIAHEVIMTVEIRDQAGIKLVRLHGELTDDEEGDFVEAVTNLLTGPGVRILIDLAEVPFMNSSGLGELVRVTAQANIQEAQVVLANLSPFVEGVLQTSQLDRFFEICPSTEEALARLR